MAVSVREDEARILVADGDAGDRTALQLVLEVSGYRVRLAETGPEALAAVHEESLLAAILDVALEGVSGYEICHAMRRALGEDLPIMLVSATRTESYDRVAGLLIGADDYVAKPSPPGEILARLRRLLERSARRAGKPALPELTIRETEVLRLFAEGLTQDEIADRLFISTKTVGTHIENIMRKLGVRTRTQAVVRAYREELVEVRDASWAGGRRRNSLKQDRDRR
jgi:DNA-binding NarL/FixJ family response regulator